MTAALPYLAPWRSNFERYSTQTYSLRAIGNSQKLITSPEGQYWRVILAQMGFNTSAVVGNRVVSLQIAGATAPATMIQTASIVQPASASYQYIYGPELTAYSNVASPNDGVAVHPIVDVLWPPGTIFAWRVNGPQAGDAFNVVEMLAVEVYRPLKDRPVAPVPIPRVV